MHILLTNDDGVQAPGLLALAQEMRQLGKVTVLAPSHNWSASGHNKTMHKPLWVRETTLADGSEALMSDGAPSDCVALALLGLVPDVDLVMSGINPHANIGDDVTYSGTVTAALEAVIGGVPGIAVSVHTTSAHQGARDYRSAALAGRRVAELVLKKGLPPRTGLSVNVPHLPYDQIKGYRVTHQGVRIYRDQLLTNINPKGQPYYWIGGEYPTAHMDEGSDYHAIENDYVSVTPLKLDLTDYNFLPEMKAWEWE
ncbi:MAG: 5'/3'-nucleotidase SurE [Anaerolineales bacterium]|nr:5'/3'-nucleotidase SurE [Anaerolineales bacterium]